MRGVGSMPHRPMTRGAPPPSSGRRPHFLIPLHVATVMMYVVAATTIVAAGAGGGGGAGGRLAFHQHMGLQQHRRGAFVAVPPAHHRGVTPTRRWQRSGAAASPTLAMSSSSSSSAASSSSSSGGGAKTSTPPGPPAVRHQHQRHHADHPEEGDVVAAIAPADTGNGHGGHGGGRGGRTAEEIRAELEGGRSLTRPATTTTNTATVDIDVVDFAGVGTQGGTRAEVALNESKARCLLSRRNQHHHHNVPNDASGLMGINDDVVAEVGHPIGAFVRSDADVQNCAAWLRSTASSRGISFSDPPDATAPQFTGDARRVGECRRLLRQAYEESGEVTAAFAKTFYLGTQLMDSKAKRAIWAIYVWCRRTDEIVDAPRLDVGSEEERNAEMLRDLSEWEVRLERLWEHGEVVDVLDLPLLDVRINYPNLPIQPFLDMIRGMLMDIPGLGQERYGTFDELHLYCYRVAGTVGLMSMPIFGCAPGYTEEEAREPALSLGVAFQLTNILRDVGEDADRRGRIYLSREDMARFNVTEQQIFERRVDDNYRELMKFEIDRARKYYDKALRGVPMLSEGSRWPVQSSLDCYGQILDKIVANDYDSLNNRAYASKWEKLLTLPLSWYRTLSVSRQFPLSGNPLDAIGISPSRVLSFLSEVDAEGQGGRGPTSPTTTIVDDVFDFASVRNEESRAERALSAAREDYLSRVDGREGVDVRHRHQHDRAAGDAGTALMGINDEVVEEVGHPIGAFVRDDGDVQECAAWLRSTAESRGVTFASSPSGGAEERRQFSAEQTRRFRTLLDSAYEESGEVTGAFAKTFYLGTQLMDERAKRAIWAIYVWCRRTDEIVDAPRESDEEMLRELSEWEVRLERLWEHGEVVDVLDLPLLDVRINYPKLPIQPFLDMVRGMLMDIPGLGQDRYETFDELHLYCYRVAGTVGLMSMPVFGCAPGFTEEEAKEPALSLGVAFQLTNILRDVGEDADRGRIYLPREDMIRFNVTEEQIFEKRMDDNYRDLMKFEIARARRYYDRALRGVPMLAEGSRWPVQSSLDCYGQILDKIVANDYDSLNNRAYASKWEKLLTLPLSWYRTLAIANYLKLPGDTTAVA